MQESFKLRKQQREEEKVTNQGGKCENACKQEIKEAMDEKGTKRTRNQKGNASVLFSKKAINQLANCNNKPQSQQFVQGICNIAALRNQEI